MRAMLWHDWTLLRKSPLYLAFAVGMWLFIPIMLAVLLSGSSPQQLATINVWGMAQGLAAWYGYTASMLAFGTLYSNSSSMDLSVVPQTDGTLENWRGSGRSMLGYCLAKSLLPVLLAEFMILTTVGYLAWAGLDASATVMRVIYVVLAPAALAFATEQMFLATHTGSMGSLSAATLIASLPMLLLTVLAFTLTLPWVLAVMVVFGLAAMGATVVSCNRRYPRVLGSIAARRP
ncbi:hypothetical protein BREU_1533 [Bifidobacterium reuteri DSM 23975]|uniref:Uncharacterized protein n=2 Tax=Bifidobacterium reuteri TaxID=983706 RepID=A0A087CSV5_9BIFI|nr:hypothetical protein BREU_1533 [Bifidobacterium reuteri DSM 23975]